MTQAQIADVVGVRQSTIAGLLGGSQRDMRWLHGERLLAVYARVSPEGHTAALQNFKALESARLAADAPIEGSTPLLTEQGRAVIETMEGRPNDMP